MLNGLLEPEKGFYFDMKALLSDGGGPFKDLRGSLLDGFHMGCCKGSMMPLRDLQGFYDMGDIETLGDSCGFPASKRPSKSGRGAGLRA